MSARPVVHDLVHRLWQDPGLRTRFEADPGAVLDEFDLTDHERRLLHDGSFPALTTLGMHPLAQMPYSLARTPAVADQISFRGYLVDLE